MDWLVLIVPVAIIGAPLAITAVCAVSERRQFGTLSRASLLTVGITVFAALSVVYVAWVGGQLHAARLEQMKTGLPIHLPWYTKFFVVFRYHEVMGGLWLLAAAIQVRRCLIIQAGWIHALTMLACAGLLMLTGQFVFAAY